MNKTKIEWVKNPDGTQGYTWNPITGCLNGCPYCYAKKLANGRLRERYRANSNTAPQIGPVCFRLFPKHPFYPRFWPERLFDFGGVLHKPKGIFVCDMGELFGDWIPRQWQEQIFTRIKLNPEHRFYLLTKQPQNLIKFLGGNITNTSKGYRRPQPLPDNCWAGVTVTNKQQAYGARDFLREVKATVKFLSLEPLLEHMDGWALANVICLADWVIIGAQTNPYKPPKIEWVEEIVGACDKAGIPVFLKDNLIALFTKLLPTRDFWASGYGMRQEMPNGTQ